MNGKLFHKLVSLENMDLSYLLSKMNFTVAEILNFKILFKPTSSVVRTSVRQQTAASSRRKRSLSMTPFSRSIFESKEKIKKKCIRSECRKRWPDGEELPKFDRGKNQVALENLITNISKKEGMSEVDQNEIRVQVLDHMQYRRKETVKGKKDQSSKKAIKEIPKKLDFQLEKVAAATSETINIDCASATVNVNDADPDATVSLDEEEEEDRIGEVPQSTQVVEEGTRSFNDIFENGQDPAIENEDTEESDDGFSQESQPVTAPIDISAFSKNNFLDVVKRYVDRKTPKRGHVIKGLITSRLKMDGKMGSMTDDEVFQQFGRKLVESKRVVVFNIPIESKEDILIMPKRGISISGTESK
ncbi:uncharacterized protein [Clytia hemisphaerica]